MPTINIDKRQVPVTARNKRIYTTSGTTTISSSSSSGGGSSMDYAYVDGSLAMRDVSINWLKNNTWKTSVLLLKEASLNMSKFKWAGGLLEPSVLSGSGTGTLDSVTSAGNTTANSIQTGSISIQHGSASLSISGTVDDTETLRFMDDGDEKLSLWSDNYNVPTSNYLKTWNTFYIKYGETKKLLIDSANTETYNNFKVQKQLPIIAISSSTGFNSIEKLQFIDNGATELEIVCDNTDLDIGYINAMKPFYIKYNGVDKLGLSGTDITLYDPLKLTSVSSATTSNVLYYNTTTKAVTYGAASGGTYNWNITGAGAGYLVASGDTMNFNDSSTIKVSASKAGTQIQLSFNVSTNTSGVSSFNTRTGTVSLTKTDVENVLTGNITSHTHSIYEPATTKLVVTSELSNSTTTVATFLTSPTLAPTSMYLVEGDILIKGAATTTGVWISFTSNSVSTITTEFDIPIGATTYSKAGATGWSGEAAVGTSTTTYMIAKLRQVIVTGANTDVIVYKYRSEVSTSAVYIGKGSNIRITKIA